MAEGRAHANVGASTNGDEGNSEILFELENAMRGVELSCMCACM
jgi:hypothetical protein